MQELSIEFYKRLFIAYIKTSVVLMSVFGFERVEIDICEKINYLLYGLKRVFVCSVFWPKICLRIAGSSFENIDYLSIFSSEMVVINNEFVFNLDFLIFEGRVLSVRKRF